MLPLWPSTKGSIVLKKKNVTCAWVLPLRPAAKRSIVQFVADLSYGEQVSSDFVRATCRQCVCVCVCARARARLCTYISMCVHSVHVWSCCVRYTHTHETQPVKRRVLLHTHKNIRTLCVLKCMLHASICTGTSRIHMYTRTLCIYTHTGDI